MGAMCEYNMIIIPYGQHQQWWHALKLIKIELQRGVIKFTFNGETKGCDTSQLYNANLCDDIVINTHLRLYCGLM